MMDEIISLVVANGIFAVLFCGLLVFELRDSRNRESKYEEIISTLGERLKTVDEIKAETERILAKVDELKSGAEKKKRVAVKTVDRQYGGVECPGPMAV